MANSVALGSQHRGMHSIRDNDGNIEYLVFLSQNITLCAIMALICKFCNQHIVGIKNLVMHALHSNCKKRWVYHLPTTVSAVYMVPLVCRVIELNGRLYVGSFATSGSVRSLLHPDMWYNQAELFPPCPSNENMTVMGLMDEIVKYFLRVKQLLMSTTKTLYDSEEKHCFSLIITLWQNLKREVIQHMYVVFTDDTPRMQSANTEYHPWKVVGKIIHVTIDGVRYTARICNNMVEITVFVCKLCKVTFNLRMNALMHMLTEHRYAPYSSTNGILNAYACGDRYEERRARESFGTETMKIEIDPTSPFWVDGVIRWSQAQVISPFLGCKLAPINTSGHLRFYLRRPAQEINALGPVAAYIENIEYCLRNIDNLNLGVMDHNAPPGTSSEVTIRAPSSTSRSADEAGSSQLDSAFPLARHSPRRLSPQPSPVASKRPRHN